MRYPLLRIFKRCCVFLSGCQVPLVHNSPLAVSEYQVPLVPHISMLFRVAARLSGTPFLATAVSGHQVPLVAHISLPFRVGARLSGTRCRPVLHSRA